MKISAYIRDIRSSDFRIRVQRLSR